MSSKSRERLSSSKVTPFFTTFSKFYPQNLYKEDGILAGYGYDTDWIQEYESLIGRKLKVFTIVNSSMIDLFEVGQREQVSLYNVQVFKASSVQCSIDEINFALNRQTTDTLKQTDIVTP